MRELRERRVVLHEDPHWPERFEAERERLRDVAGEGLLGVFHVGSTAVRDVPGKPALDVIAVYDDETAVEAAVGRLTEDDRYEREPDTTVVVRWEADWAVFCKAHARDDETVRNQLLFREYLRENPEARREYARVKREAAEEHPDDLESYTRAKWDVVSSILERAREGGYEERLPAFA